MSQKTKINTNLKRIAAWMLAISLVFAATPTVAVAKTPKALAQGINIPTLIRLYDQAKELPSSSKSHTRPPFRTVKTIVLDPGHGGENDGAVGVAHQYEKRLTLQLAFELRDALKQAHPEVQVYLTRYDDRKLTLGERIAFANERKADIFISLHYNAAVHNRALGYETYVLSPDAQRKHCKKPLHSMTCRDQANGSKLLGETILHAFEIHHPDMINRGLKDANFGVLRGAKMPAVVVEAGFLTHPEEGKKVVTPEHRSATVAALLQAIEAYDNSDDA